MMRANRSTLAKLFLLTTLVLPVERAASATVSHSTQNTDNTHLLLAQTDRPETEFSLPDSLDGEEALLIDGSSSMRNLNTALTAEFQERYADVAVETEENGSDIAIDRLLSGEIDLAAIGRPLTQAEKDAGLTAIPIAREKIAIIIGPDNPFDGDVTFQQFGEIFRGEITDWSELGGEAGPVRFVDRPEFSDTRLAFQSYPVFQEAPFETGSTADPVFADETEVVIEALGDDGLGYAIANQVLSNDDVAIVPMHKTLPDNPAYPFSQARSYVYLGEPSPAVQGFLGVAQSDEGETAVEEVQDAEGAAAVEIEGPGPTAESPDGTIFASTNEENLAVLEDADGTLIVDPLIGAGGAVTALAFSPDGETLATGTNNGKVRYWGIDGEPKGEAFQAITGEDNAVTELSFDENDKLLAAGSNGRRGFWGLNGRPFGETGGATTSSGAASGETSGAAAATTGETEPFPLWVWLLPLLALIGGGLWWLLGRRRDTAPAEAPRQTAPTATIAPPDTDPATPREVSNRAKTVVSTDRVTDESRVLDASTAPPTPPAAPLPVGLPGIETPAAAAAEATPPLPAYESTDLESPNLEGTNLDLSTPAVIGGAAALGGAAFAGLSADVEPDDDVEADAWGDNIDLTLDDDPAEETVIELGPQTGAEETSAEETSTEEISTKETSPPAIAMPTVNTAEATEADSVSNLESIEPTRSTVIAETETILDIEPTRETIIGDSAVIFSEAAETAADDSNPVSVTPAAAGITAAAGIAAVAVTTVQTSSGSNTDLTALSDTPSSPGESRPLTIDDLASVDDGLAELPEGYGDSRIVLLPRDPKWAYAYWDVSNEHKDELRRQGGQRLMLRLYDVTDIDIDSQSPHSMQQQDCHEMARSWYLEVPVSDRDYVAELGYLTSDDRWLMLTRSAQIRVPPIYPSDWVKDQFVTIDWNDSLAGRTFGDLGRPDAPAGAESEDMPQIYEDLFNVTQSQDALRVAGSLYGSMQPVAPGALSASGNVSGLNASGLNVSGLNVSGLNMSGVGRVRNFWLVADAELIVYGATEPDATLTIGDRVVPLNPDGTFRFHMAFPDGQIDYPIRAVAADGEQSRSIHMHFERETPERNTNTKAEAKDEWF